jgi:hypothetical protein
MVAISVKAFFTSLDGKVKTFLAKLYRRRAKKKFRSEILSNV